MTLDSEHWKGWRHSDPGLGGLWFYAEHRTMPVIVSVLVRPTASGASTYPAAIRVERTDGKAIGATDLQLPISYLIKRAREVEPWVTGSAAVDHRAEHPGPPGRRGHSGQHWRTVADLWSTARQVAPGREVLWMRQQWDTPVKDSTMRRWRDRAVQWARDNDYTPGQSPGGETQREGT